MRIWACMYERERERGKISAKYECMLKRTRGECAGDRQKKLRLLGDKVFLRVEESDARKRERGGGGVRDFEVDGS